MAAGGVEAGRSHRKGCSTGTGWHLCFGSIFFSSFSLLVQNHQWHRDAACPNSQVTDSTLPSGKDFLDTCVHSCICPYVYIHVRMCRKQTAVRFWGETLMIETYSWDQPLEGKRRRQEAGEGDFALQGRPVTETPWAVLELERPSELSQTGPRRAGLDALT